MTDNKGLTGQSQENNGGEDCAFGADRPARERAVELLAGFVAPGWGPDEGPSHDDRARELVDALVAAVRESLEPEPCGKPVDTTVGLLAEYPAGLPCGRPVGHPGDCGRAV